MNRTRCDALSLPPKTVVLMNSSMLPIAVANISATTITATWRTAQVQSVLMFVFFAILRFSVGQIFRSSSVHLIPSTSCMSYMPAGFPFRKRAARSAPSAKVARLLALWVISMRSPVPANSTV